MPELFDHQQNFVEQVVHMPSPVRACLYFKTGAGKTRAALEGMKALGENHVLVIAPPSTYRSWTEAAEQAGLTIDVMSHAKFRLPKTKVDKSTAIIADEFHLFGGQPGQGWRKLDRVAAGLKAPMILLSATPNYNDAERVYCVQHILDPKSVSGGYLQFLYANCVTKQNPFGQIPEVVGFHKYANACEFLVDLPAVFHVPDDLVYDIQEHHYDPELDPLLWELRYNRRAHRMISSDIELRHTMTFQGLVDGYERVKKYIVDDLLDRIAQRGGTALVYCNHATVAYALAASLNELKHDYFLITGKTGTRSKLEVLDEYMKQGGILIGTAAIATGTDGLDKMCDTLFILDDTDDDALRRQLIGRIMPRGMGDNDTSGKEVHRYLPIL